MYKGVLAKLARPKVRITHRFGSTWLTAKHMSTQFFGGEAVGGLVIWIQYKEKDNRMGKEKQHRMRLRQLTQKGD